MESGLIYAIVLFVLFFALLTYSYGQFACVVLKWSKKPRIAKKNGKKILMPGKLTTSEYINCYIPVLQAVAVRKALYKKNGPFLVMGVLGIILVLLRLVGTFILAAPVLVHVITIYGILLGIILIFLTYGIITADCAKMYGFNYFIIFTNFLVPCIACFWLQNNIADAMRKLHKEDTFNEHTADTVVKQRHR